MAGIRIEGNTSGNVAEVDASNRLKIVLPTDAATPSNIGGVRFFSENDAGSITGTAYLLSPETDDDYRLRVAQDTLFDYEAFNYTAQNTGKHNYTNTTMAAAWSTGQVTTNSGSITTTTTGLVIRTYATFPVVKGAHTYVEVELAFSTSGASAPANTVVDFGLFIPNAANPYAATDGIYFRFGASGLFGVLNFNGTETQVDLSALFTAVANKKQKFTISITDTVADFWLDDVYLGELATPDGNGLPCAAGALPFAIRHSIVGGAAGSVFQVALNSYAVSVGGYDTDRSAGVRGNSILGSYQGTSGGTMGSTANYANSANPTAAVPTNTTAALGTGLGGQFWETDTLAITTDGIICSYQNPAATATLTGRRIAIYGVKIESYVQTALTGGGYNAQFALAFGHTAVSLATTEAATTKAPRRIPLGTHSVASGAAALVQLTTVSARFDGGPVIVNPGEFIAVIKKKVGTAPSAGVIAHMVTFNFSYLL